MALSIFFSKSDQYRFWIILIVLLILGKFGYAADYYSNPATEIGCFNKANVWATTRAAATLAYPVDALKSEKMQAEIN